MWGNAVLLSLLFQQLLRSLSSSLHFTLFFLFISVLFPTGRLEITSHKSSFFTNFHPNRSQIYLALFGEQLVSAVQSGATRVSG